MVILREKNTAIGAHEAREQLNPCPQVGSFEVSFPDNITNTADTQNIATITSTRHEKGAKIPAR